MPTPKVWREGEKSEALCTTCKGRQTTTFQFRPFELEVSRITVPNVLIAVCDGCGDSVSLPHQEVPKIKAARLQALRRDVQLGKDQLSRGETVSSDEVSARRRARRSE
jgi:hypothetical protein